MLAAARALDAFNAKIAERMTGDVRVKLVRGRAVVTGSRSPFALYDENLATYGNGDTFKHDAATGFIEISGLPVAAGAAKAGEAAQHSGLVTSGRIAPIGEQPRLQWGGRFAGAPDPALIAFGSSLEDDLVLAPFDVRCSHAHVTALASGGLLDAARGRRAARARSTPSPSEIASGTFAAFARAGTFEDVHGAIDARVRELAPDAGASLHAGRSRNDQVATTLLLYARDRASDRHAPRARDRARIRGPGAPRGARTATLLAATTHWQPAQPVSLAFWLDAAAQPFVRAAERFARVALDAARFCPLGSSALAGSSLPLDRHAAARELGFAEPSRNALDTVGDRDVALDLLHAAARAAIAASRPSEEFVLWTTPAFGYARLGDAAATGSSLMPQKKNPDPFELVRAAAAGRSDAYTGALASTHRHRPLVPPRLAGDQSAGRPRHRTRARRARRLRARASRTCPSSTRAMTAQGRRRLHGRHRPGRRDDRRRRRPPARRTRRSANASCAAERRAAPLDAERSRSHRRRRRAPATARPRSAPSGPAVRPTPSASPRRSQPRSERSTSSRKSWHDRASTSSARPAMPQPS